MRKSVTLAAVWLLASCGTSKAVDDTAPVCDATITGTAPVDASGPHARDQSIVLTTTGTASSATITETNAKGEAIAGTTTIADGTVTFTATDALPKNATISWSATVCSATASGTFLTGTAATSVDPTTLADKAYAIDLSTATWVQPANGGDLLKQYFGGVFLVGVQSATSVKLDTILASGQDNGSGSWQQDPCYATVDFDPVDFSNDPYFEVTTPHMLYTVGTTTVDMHHVDLKGALTVDSIIDGEFAAELDLRDYSGIDCSTLSMVGMSCVACQDDGQTYCVELQATNVTGSLVAGLTIVPNTTPQECNNDTGGK